ncbi:hypothetical protein D3C72_1708990 [compost metagenome]
MSAPSEMRCRSMPSSYMMAKVAASTSGMVMAITRPERQPIDRKETTSTIISASPSAFMNSPTASVTTSGWLEIWSTTTP